MTPTPMKRATSTALSVHLNEGKLTGEVSHQEHQSSDGVYPVVKMTFDGLDLTIYPTRERAIEFANVLTLMAAELRDGADRYNSAR